MNNGDIMKIAKSSLLAIVLSVVSVYPRLGWPASQIGDRHDRYLFGVSLYANEQRDMTPGATRWPRFAIPQHKPQIRV